VALRQVKISDIDGVDGANITIVIRDGYPGMDAAKAIDVTPEQAEAIQGKALKNAVTLEVRSEDGSTRDLLVSKTDLDKWLVKPDEVIAAARGLKGRVPGFSPRSNGN
jgi:hypothetical protein